MKVKDIDNRQDLILISDSQHIKPILKDLNSPHDFDCIFIKAEDGEIIEAYGCFGIPYVYKSLYELEIK